MDDCFVLVHNININNMPPRPESPERVLTARCQHTKSEAVSPDRGDLESGRLEPIKRIKRHPRNSFYDKSLPPTTTLPLLVLVDMFAVSLVVPLLFQYYKTAGVTSAAQRELLSSVFSISQIVGGLLMGVLVDARMLKRKTVLFVSFAGSALSYALIVVGHMSALLISRVLVGLVKQTMTVTTALLTHHSSTQTRAMHLGRLSAASTVAWIAGPTVGALLYKYVDPTAPAVVACGLFVLNLILAAVLLDDLDDDESAMSSSTVKLKITNLSRIVQNLRSCFSSKVLGMTVVTKLITVWVTKATSYSQLGSFYEDMYDLEPHHRGYISSYQQFLQFAVNLWLVSHVLAITGGERQATVACVAVLSLAVWLESLQSLWLFLLVLCPILSLSFAISDLSLQTLVTHVAPSSSLFSVLAAVDVLQNAVSVSVPFYRTL